MFEGLHERSQRAGTLGQYKILDDKICKSRFYQKRSFEMSFDSLLPVEIINDLDSELIDVQFLGMIDEKYSYKFKF